MILQALYRRYQYLLDTEGDQMPSEEYSSADVSFEMHLDASGLVTALFPYVDEKGKSKKVTYNVPKQIKRSSGIQPFFLCDKAEYIFGSALPLREACREKMGQLWCSVLEYAAQDTPEVIALRSFVQMSPERLTMHLNEFIDDSLKEALCKGGLLILKYSPTGAFFHNDRMIRQAWEKYFQAQQGTDEAGSEQICLITGEQTPANRIARLHPSIKNVVGAQSSGAALVSFNIPSFCSFGREQSYNAPASQKAADAYGYVLNRLLADRRHKTRMNDMTVVYWAESTSAKEQEWLSSLFQEGAEDDTGSHSPDVETVQSRLKASMNRIQQGQTFQDTFDDLDESTTFCILGLSPNAARISVRFWYTGTIGEIGGRVWQHYKDLSVTGLDRSPSVKQLLREIAVGHEWDNIPPNMEGQLLRCILLGLPYSRAVFAQLMNRIRAEADDPKKGLYKIGALRAGMIKAYLLRKARMSNDSKLEGELTMALNEQSTSTPYHLGRLFACLERAQISALGQGINATIRDRYWGAASATPANVFPRLLSVAQHHISKDEEWGRSNDHRIQEVMNALPQQFPRRLSLEEQGMFALGYYQQRQHFYVKKAESNHG